MNEISNRFDDITRAMNDFFGFNTAFFNTPVTSIATNGFKSRLHRPHNLIEVKDDDGNLVSQRIEVTTTPFSKDEVKIIIKDNVITVRCGTENKKDEENEDVVYRGISSQMYTFSLSIPDSVDKKKITAVNKDGILKIDMPIKKEEKKEPEEIEIKID